MLEVTCRGVCCKVRWINTGVGIKGIELKIWEKVNWMNVEEGNESWMGVGWEDGRERKPLLYVFQLL